VTITKLGKIRKVEVGLGGYQDMMLGVTYQLEGPSFGTARHRGSWGPEIKHTDSCAWSEADRHGEIGAALWQLGQVLVQAKKRTAEELAGVPVEMTFDGNALVSWRVLEEVL